MGSATSMTAFLAAVSEVILAAFCAERPPPVPIQRAPQNFKSRQNALRAVRLLSFETRQGR